MTRNPFRRDAREQEPRWRVDAVDAASAAYSREELSEASFRGLRFTATARGLSEMAALVSSVVLARLIPPAEFGYAAIALIVPLMATAVATQGVSAFLVKEKNPTREQFEVGALLAWGGGLALGAAVFVLAEGLSGVLGSRPSALIQLASPVFAISAGRAVSLAAMQRQLRFPQLSAMNVSATWISVAVSIGLAIAGLEAEALILGVLSGSVVSALWLTTLRRSPRPRWHPEEGRKALSFGAPAVASTLLTIGNRNLDYVILTAMLAPAQVGFYWRGFQLGGEYQQKLTKIVSGMALPIYSRTEDVAHMRRARLRIVRVQSTVLFPFLALLIVVAPVLVPFVYGERWEPAVPLAQILAVSGMASTLGNGIGPLLLAIGRAKALLAWTLFSFVFVNSGVFLGASVGVVGAAVGASSARVAAVTLMYTMVLPRTAGIPFKMSLGEFGPGAICAAGAGAVGLALVAALPPVAAPIELAAVATVTAVAYLGLLRLLFGGAWDDLAKVVARFIEPLSRRARLRATKVTSVEKPSGTGR